MATINDGSASDRSDTRLWHPFADMSAVRHTELVISRAEDVWVWDSADRRYLDATASLWYANVGHGRREIVDAVSRQMGRLEAYSIFGDLANEPALELAQRLSDLAPMPDARVFFTSGGGDAVDTAAKLARRYWHAQGQSERIHLISRTGGYHGTHGFGTSLAGIDSNRVGYEPLLTATSRVPHDSAEALEREILDRGPDQVAAFFVEPVIGSGGVIPPAEGYLAEAHAICRKYGVLFIADSVICGFGRLGTWFGIERWGLEPDLIVFAKGVTSGYLPLGGVVVSDEIARPFWDEPGEVFRHGPTYSGHPVCCAAALANLDLLENEGLVRQGEALEAELFDRLEPLTEHPLVLEVRGGTGLLAAVELQPEVAAKGQATQELYRHARDAGVLVRPLSTAVIVSPPLTIEPDALDLLASAVRTALDKLADGTAATA